MASLFDIGKAIPSIASSVAEHGFDKYKDSIRFYGEIKEVVQGFSDQELIMAVGCFNLPNEKGVAEMTREYFLELSQEQLYFKQFATACWGELKNRGYPTKEGVIKKIFIENILPEYNKNKNITYSYQSAPDNISKKTKNRLFVFPKNSESYYNFVREFGQKKVDEVYNQLDDMEEWIPEMDTKQLIIYVGCFETFDKLPQSQAYIQEHFPDLLENKFQFQTLSVMAHNELKQNRGYRFKDRMIDEFYEIMGLNTQSYVEDSNFKNDNTSNNSDPQWETLPWYKKVYYAFLGICLIYWVCRGLYWLFTVIF